MRRYGRLLVSLVGVVASLVVAYLVTVRGATLLPIRFELGEAGAYYVTHSYVTGFSLRVRSVVNAVIWDFRAVDTFFETAVLLAALLATLTFTGWLGRCVQGQSKGAELSPLVTTVFKLSLPLALAVAGGLALQGHFSPGGGFQAGAVVAVVTFLFMATHGVARGWLGRVKVLLLVRGAALLALSVLAVAPAVIGMLYGLGPYALTGRSVPKLVVPGCCVVPAYTLLLNVFEAVAVTAAFTLVGLIMWSPTCGEDHE